MPLLGYSTANKFSVGCHEPSFYISLSLPQIHYGYFWFLVLSLKNCSTLSQISSAVGYIECPFMWYKETSCKSCHICYFQICSVLLAAGCSFLSLLCISVFLSVCLSVWPSIFVRFSLSFCYQVLSEMAP